MKAMQHVYDTFAGLRSAPESGQEYPNQCLAVVAICLLLRILGSESNGYSRCCPRNIALVIMLTKYGSSPNTQTNEYFLLVAPTKLLPNVS